MNIVNKFIAEVNNFTRKNWWVYIIYLFIIAGIFITQKDRLLSTFLITSLHFIADIFIMMMFSSYRQRNYKEGTYFQIVSLFIFLTLKVYTGYTDGGWHYLLADPLYILAAIKNYKKDVLNENFTIVNLGSLIVLSIVLISIVLLSDHYRPLIFNTVAKCIQTTGIFIFAIALSITTDERLRMKISILGLVCMVAGSAWEMINTWNEHQVVGLSISYMLLPLTVLIFNMRSQLNK